MKTLTTRQHHGDRGHHASDSPVLMLSIKYSQQYCPTVQYLDCGGKLDRFLLKDYNTDFNSIALKDRKQINELIVN